MKILMWIAIIIFLFIAVCSAFVKEWEKPK